MESSLVMQSAENPLSAGLPTQDEVLAAAKGPATDRSTSPLPTVTACRQFAKSVEIQGGRNLNTEQRWAIASFIMNAGAGCPFTIYGPPGTGKTVTLVECALQVNSLTLHAHQLLQEFLEIKREFLEIKRGAGVKAGQHCQAVADASLPSKPDLSITLSKNVEINLNIFVSLAFLSAVAATLKPILLVVLSVVFARRQTLNSAHAFSFILHSYSLCREFHTESSHKEASIIFLMHADSEQGGGCQAAAVCPTRLQCGSAGQCIGDSRLEAHRDAAPGRPTPSACTNERGKRTILLESTSFVGQYKCHLRQSCMSSQEKRNMLLSH